MSKIIEGSAEWARFKDIIDTQLGIHQDFTVVAQVQEIEGMFYV